MSKSGPSTHNHLSSEEIKENQIAERKRQEALALQRAQRVVEQEYRLDNQVFAPLRSHRTLQQSAPAALLGDAPALPGDAAIPKISIRTTKDNNRKCK